MSAPLSEVKTIFVTEFSKVPSGRYAKDGPDSGQIFREKYLAPAFKTFRKIVVRLDGAAGFPSSFLDEAFGGLVRAEGLSAKELHQRLAVVCDEPELARYTSLIWRYIDRATGSASEAH